MPSLFLPPPGPSQPPPYFRSTEDLLKRFQLLPAYDKYVRPYAPPVSHLGATDKGKGKEVPPSSPAAPTPGPGGDGDDEDGGKGEKKHKNYKQLIKAIPGKHSMRKDTYLADLMMVPPKQKQEIKPFSQKTTREAFSVSLEGLKGWNINALVAESPQAREDRKRRKELKKLAKQGQGMVQGAAAAGPNTPVSGVPTTPGVAPPNGTVPLAAPPRTATPRPGVVKPPPAGIGTPHSVSTPAPAVSTPAPTQQHPAAAAPHRGVKREREENGLQVNGNIPPPGGDVKVAKAGVPGVRPRPVKRARLDANGQPYQQPTPHA
ncbi:hypothetical protein L226DRAFT_548215 [Lentinus tigrinus ALCF2SS1-7]|uniref:Mediator of RNA polymerase II transcription subunit 19 n=1 Tax=Lentinus tigrinus ALCF2SS1-6 TaxID=1328759 RepID=A0A5C2RUS4_9APHY|nr:hypothetical protein L227DRAFT_588992 [Lentinus tigrinus ALCF2SS1-6]RPD69281.1 hypothetical protein L226DRAFT_548215 [Lentinus tigrinus ALCF2SS1-7]